jgi:hypothetical protein
MRFEPLHLRADSRLREPDARACAGEGAMLRNGDESLKLAKHDSSISLLLSLTIYRFSAKIMID